MVSVLACNFSLKLRFAIKIPGYLIARVMLSGTLLNPADYNWEVPPPGPARDEHLRRLFMSKKDVRRITNDHSLLCANEPRIDWSLFIQDWDWAEIKTTAVMLLFDDCTESIYVGITASPIWRFRLCEDHGDEGFVPHYLKYDRMVVLVLERTEAIIEMETMLVDELSMHGEGFKLKNKTNYVRGPIRSKIAFLYLCIKDRSQSP